MKLVVILLVVSALTPVFAANSPDDPGKTDPNQSKYFLTDKMKGGGMNRKSVQGTLKREFKILKSKMNKNNAELDLKLDHIKSYETNMNSNINSKHDSLNTNLNSKLQALTNNINNMNSNLMAKIQSLESLSKNNGCPDGTFFFPPSNQCFRLLHDKWRKYDEAKAACKALGLELAHPLDPLALRSYLTTKHGLTRFAWIGARGNGKAMTWERTGVAISQSNPLWECSSNQITSSWCLLLATAEHRWKAKPANTYCNQYCTSGELAICEYIAE